MREERPPHRRIAPCEAIAVAEAITRAARARIKRRRRPAEPTRVHSAELSVSEQDTWAEHRAALDATLFRAEVTVVWVLREGELERA
jgi:hypothetical protein